jgi:hypothetical protein
VLKKYENYIKDKVVTSYFNDDKKYKIKKLEELIRSGIFEFINVKTDSLDYAEAFAKYKNEMGRHDSANFLFIDPTGILRPDIFYTLSRFKFTDFLLFIPAHFIPRFKETHEFENKWPGIKDLPSRPKDVPKAFCQKLLKPFVPEGYYLSHFAIRKYDSGSIHGLIFGSGNIRGLDKFLERCWKLDPDNGEANFKLDGDIPLYKDQHSLTSVETSSKLRDFKVFLVDQILSRKVVTNKDSYILTLKKACLPKHAKEVCSDLKRKGKIAKTFPISYDSIIRKKRIETIELVK